MSLSRTDGCKKTSDLFSRWTKCTFQVSRIQKDNQWYPITSWLGGFKTKASGAPSLWWGAKIHTNRGVRGAELINSFFIILEQKFWWSDFARDQIKSLRRFGKLFFSSEDTNCRKKIVSKFFWLVFSESFVTYADPSLNEIEVKLHFSSKFLR